MHLEHVLSEIQTDRGNLHADDRLMWFVLQRSRLGTFDAGSGRRPPHQQLRQPPQTLYALLQWRRHQITRQLCRMVAHDRPTINRMFAVALGYATT